MIMLLVSLMFEEGTFKVGCKPLPSPLTIEMKIVARNIEIFDYVIIFKAGFLEGYNVTFQELF